MDPLSQAVVGAAASGIAKRRQHKYMPDMLWAGALGGMAPDLDVLIRSSHNPLLSLEYHRHFTHAFITAPLIGLITGWLLWLLYTAVGRRLPKTHLIGAAIFGAATHGLLDTTTSYGTLLFWPFTNTRLATDWMSIIDPLFTLPLLVACIWAGRARQVKPLYIGSAFCLLYMAAMAVYHHIGLSAQSALIAERGHHATKQRVMPGLFPPLSYRSVYRDEQTIYIDALTLDLIGRPHWQVGGHVPLTHADALENMAEPNSKLAHDLHTFNWFADGFLAPINGNTQQLGDYRYVNPHTLQPFWGIELPPNRTDHVRRISLRNLDDMLNKQRP